MPCVFDLSWRTGTKRSTTKPAKKKKHKKKVMHLWDELEFGVGLLFMLHHQIDRPKELCLIT
jgi:hypothetical protein